MLVAHWVKRCKRPILGRVSSVVGVCTASWKDYAMVILICCKKMEASRKLTDSRTGKTAGYGVVTVCVDPFFFFFFSQGVANKKSKEKKIGLKGCLRTRNEYELWHDNEVLHCSAS